MNELSGVTAIFAKQQAHARHARIMQEATPLSQEIMEMSIAASFEAQAAISPQRLAVVATSAVDETTVVSDMNLTSDRKSALTYQELNCAANRLAHHLLAMGITIGTPVAIIMSQSVDTVVSLIAVVKAGGYFCCLEPTMPVPRMQELLQRAGVQIIITSSAFAAYVEQVAPAQSIYLLLDQLAASDWVHNPNIAITPRDLLSMTFTSGSTGTPKVISKTHQAQQYSAWQSSIDYILSPADRYACIYQLNAGLSSRALFSALLTGGAFYLYPQVNYDMGGWATWLEKHEITQLYGPTGAVRELMYTRPDGPNFPAMRLIQVAGQTIYRQDAEMFQRCFCRGAIFCSLYGMAEISTVTHYLIDHDTQFEGDTLPIGYPIAGRTILILSEEGHPVVDQPGEIVLRHWATTPRDVGDVINDAVKNGAKLDNGTQETTGIQETDAGAYTLFHTGDVGLQRPDGCLLHLGRKDDMVKVRGHRVILIEVESWLRKISGVAQAAVKVFPTISGDNRMVGYVTQIAQAQLTEAAMRAELAQSIPFYMIPARIVVLETMPLTVTGKADRQALPPPDSTRPQLITPFVAPRNAVEQQIADIWGRLLGLDEIGVNDNFFELGGDSLSAVRMVLAVENATGATVPSDYFRSPTVAALASFHTPDKASVTETILRASEPTHLAQVDQERPQPANKGYTPQNSYATRNDQRLLTRLVAGQISTTTVFTKLIHTRLRGLSYERGVKWLAWLGRPALANRLFAHERNCFQTLARELNNPAAATDKTFATNVLGNLIHNSFQRAWHSRPIAPSALLATMQRSPHLFWRTFAHSGGLPVADQVHEVNIARFHVHGLEHLVYAQKQGRGTILLTYHSTAGLLSGALLAHQYNLGPTLDVSLEQAEFMAERTEESAAGATGLARVTSGWAASYTLQAQRILQKGGVVRIANDVTYDATNSLVKTIGQRYYHLKPGFAELALTTRATVLPFYSAFDGAGNIHLTILPALIAPMQTRDPNSFIDMLLDQYVAFLETTWRKSPESLGWGALRRYNSRPLAVAPVPAEFAKQMSGG